MSDHICICEACNSAFMDTDPTAEVCPACALDITVQALVERLAELHPEQ